MSWSLYIRDGDLTLAGPGGFAIVTGAQKLIQDLKHWILESRGSDPMHPEFGSTLDGGMLPDGTLVPTSIGEVVDRERLMNIESELRRILIAYQEQQQDRLQREAALYRGKNTFAAGEILADVLAVTVEQREDTVVAFIRILTESGANVEFAQPVA
jgi:hypothetical protein